MTEYHKINAPFNRDSRGTLINGEWCMPEFEYLANNEWEFTEKVDGTNIRITIHRINDSLIIHPYGRTDNAQIPKPLMAELNSLFGGEGQGEHWNRPDRRGPSVADAIGYEMVHHDIDFMVIYGEGYGPKIQNGGKYTDKPSFVVFDVLVGNWWLKREDVDSFCKTVGLDSVPVIGYGTLYDAMQLVKYGAAITRSGQTIDRAISLSGGNYMKSEWGDFEAEGIVARPKVPLFDRAGRRIITKIKAKDFR